jgi:flagellar hook-associated protein 1
MGNLFTSILNTANSIRVYDRQLAAIQNNIANADTPGYVRQVQTVQALRFDLAAGLGGGVSAGPVLSARNTYAEVSVRTQMTAAAYSGQKASDLSRLETHFDPSGSSGVAGAMSKLFLSFSQLSVNPNDRVARQSVLDRAHGVAEAFNQTAASLANLGQQADKQTRDAVLAVNRLGEQLQEINRTYRSSAQSTADAGLDAKMHGALEALAELVDFTLIEAGDGTMAVYIGGQTPLVIGDRLFRISGDFSDAQTAIRDANGDDISGQIHSGKLGALLDEKNRVIPAYLAHLDSLAAAFAQQVNTQLAAGEDAAGAAPQMDLFRSDPAAGVALSLAVNPLLPEQLAAATAGSPGSNGNALTLASMLDRKAIDGHTFIEYFGSLGGRVGRDLVTARQDLTTRNALVTQARTFRKEISGVSLDEEAAHLLQVQRAYQAAGKVMSVLNQMTDTLIQALR